MGYENLEKKYREILSRIIVPQYHIIDGTLADFRWLRVLRNITYTKYGVDLQEVCGISFYDGW